ncbi:hypothetical protein F442_12613 [Plasmopara halstedii]|uniref:Tyrosinase copper-binding domain-containing protein n=1 Tax=Plasmopara halstedii TaxID=4781 RepID=A0A0P1AY18_PLAHL|nr:hypothetical protein F442_12613 [Plasmopara halstedii]CEG46444.1 hypothetical protein F442_12613 [Plasmopara halstedii]|eukprot:XP_024582813.1 hypothetical protein F442_12613 [Plasmopara halstedii]
MRLVWILNVGIFAFISRLVTSQTCGPRLRKDWDMLTASEKSTYRGAIAAAMNSGAYIKFVEMHTEMMSEREAHRQCMFIYWHRLLLVAFENMLRGQGPAFACVTVPYFNWVAGSSRATSGACTSVGSCLAIARELGGWTSGVQRTISINGVINSGRCINVSPLDQFCQSSSSTGTTCARCVPRSDWGTVRIPSSAGYAAVRNQVFSGINIGQMSPLIEQGCHNNIHANLASTMGTFAAPADPAFWSHHAMVDLLHVIFHKCRVGTARLTFAQKASHPVAWTSCARRDSNIPFQPTDVVTMRTGERGINPISALSDPLVGRYFAGVPNQFAGLMDTRDLGTSSYGYSISGQVATMYTQCDSSPTSRRLRETNTTTPKPKMCGMADESIDYASQNNFPETDYTGVDDGHQDVVIVGCKTGKPVDENTPKEDYISDPAELKVVNWYDQTVEAMGGDTQENMDDLERQACMFEHICLGGTKDYTPEFKAMWKPKEPRCKAIVDAVINGSQSIQYEAWLEDMESVFGCPEPTKTNTTGSWSSSGSFDDSLDSANDTIHFPDVLEPGSVTTWDD